VSDVTVISCLYGDTHDRFVTDWARGVARLKPQPDAVIVSVDRLREIPGATVIPATCTWEHEQAFHLQAALSWVTTEWVWVHDIDDIAMPDALGGLRRVTEDVWQFGYLRSDGEEYLPPQLTADQVLAADRNPFVAGSCIRTEKLREVGGFPDVALQDWALWRNLARAGATFRSSKRPHFHYMRHDGTRGQTELVAARRPQHLAEMIDQENRVARPV